MFSEPRNPSAVANPSQPRPGRVEAKNSRDQRDATEGATPPVGDVAARAARAVEWLSRTGVDAAIVTGRLKLPDHPRLTPEIRSRLEALEPDIVPLLLGVRHHHAEALPAGRVEPSGRAERDLEPSDADNAPAASAAPANRPSGPAAWLADKRCECCGSREASFGVGFDFRAPEQTRWFCAEHRPQ